LGLQSELDFVLASGAEGISKPDPAFFRLAAARAGVPPGAALMVGDSYRADVEGARASGMQAVLLARPEWRDQRETPPDGVTVIGSLSELPALVVGR
jgi:putative hydrolase of the HAD superfamily